MTLALEDKISDLLDVSKWAGAVRRPLAGDASRRRYERISRHDRSAILMISPPEIDPSLPQFLKIAGALRAAGVSAPEVFAADEASGLAIVEDLGPVILEHPDLSDPMIAVRVAADLISLYGDVAIEASSPTPEDLIEAMHLAKGFYPAVDQQAFSDLTAGLRLRLVALDDMPKALSLRDYHAGNLTWLPGRTGLARIGVLDFQDAFYAHPAYDLVSLLNDARVPYPNDVKADLRRAFASHAGQVAEDVEFAFAALTVQRNIRILGIFHRLANELRKPDYLRFVPYTWSTISEALLHPDLLELRPFFLKALPKPVASLTGLKRRQ